MAKKFTLKVWHLIVLMVILILLAKGGQFERMGLAGEGRKGSELGRAADASCSVAVPIWGVIQCLADAEFTTDTALTGFDANDQKITNGFVSYTGMSVDVAYGYTDVSTNAQEGIIYNIHGGCEKVSTLGCFSSCDLRYGVSSDLGCCDTGGGICQKLGYPMVSSCSSEIKVKGRAEFGAYCYCGVLCGSKKIAVESLVGKIKTRWNNLYYGSGDMGVSVRLSETNGCYPYKIKEEYFGAGTTTDLSKINAEMTKITPPTGTGKEVNSFNQIPEVSLYNPMDLYEWYRFPESWEARLDVGVVRVSEKYGDVICRTTATGKSIFKAQRVDTEDENCYKVPTTLLASGLDCCQDEDCTHFGDFHCNPSTFTCEAGKPSEQDCNFWGYPSDALCGGTSVEEGVCYEDHTTGKHYIKNTYCDKVSMKCIGKDPSPIECCNTEDCSAKIQQTGKQYVCYNNECKIDIEYGDCPAWACCSKDNTKGYTPKTCTDQGFNDYECCNPGDTGVGYCAKSCTATPPSGFMDWWNKLIDAIGKTFGVAGEVAKVLTWIIIIIVVIILLVLLSKASRGRGGALGAGGLGTPVTIANIVNGANPGNWGAPVRQGWTMPQGVQTYSLGKWLRGKMR